MYKRQIQKNEDRDAWSDVMQHGLGITSAILWKRSAVQDAGGWDATCLLYTSDAADERSSVDLGGRRIIKKQKIEKKTEKKTKTKKTKVQEMYDYTM